jgi:hypothetical protein
MSTLPWIQLVGATFGQIIDVSLVLNRTVYDFENCDTEQDSRDLVPYIASNVFYAPYKDLTVLCGEKNISYSTRVSEDGIRHGQCGV